MTDPSKFCAKCGQAHDPRKCVGHVDHDGGSVRPCGNFPRLGATVCGYHGGAAPQTKAKAARNHERQQATVALARTVAEIEALVGESMPADHTEALLQALELASRKTAVYELLVADLQAGDGGLWGPDHLEDARSHIAVEELHRWNRQKAQLAALAARLGIEERRVGLQERQGRQVAAMVRALVESLLALVVRNLDEPHGTAVAEAWRAELPSLIRAHVIDVAGHEVGVAEEGTSGAAHPQHQPR